MEEGKLSIRVSLQESEESIFVGHGSFSILSYIGPGNGNGVSTILMGCTWDGMDSGEPALRNQLQESIVLSFLFSEILHGPRGACFYLEPLEALMSLIFLFPSSMALSLNLLQSWLTESVLHYISCFLLKEPILFVSGFFFFSF